MAETPVDAAADDVMGTADDCGADSCGVVLAAPMTSGHAMADWDVCVAVLVAFAVLLLAAVLLRKRRADTTAHRAGLFGPARPSGQTGRSHLRHGVGPAHIGHPARLQPRPGLHRAAASCAAPVRHRKVTPTMTRTLVRPPPSPIALLLAACGDDGTMPGMQHGSVAGSSCGPRGSRSAVSATTVVGMPPMAARSL